MKKFENSKNEFLLFLELDRGYSIQTISAYRRDIELYQNFVEENKLNYLKAKKEIIFDFNQVYKMWLVQGHLLGFYQRLEHFINFCIWKIWLMI